jgi:hypothetical protein
MIVYGANLHDYFLGEFSGLTGVEYTVSSQLTPEQFEEVQEIPFWGDFIS